MNDKVDFTKVYPREYRVMFRFSIDCPDTFSNKSFYYSHYIPKWSSFISQIMQKKLSKTEAREILPQIRNNMPSRLRLSHIYPLLYSKEPALARSLLDASVVFDAAPNELKAHIVTCFGIQPQEMINYFDESEKERNVA